AWIALGFIGSLGLHTFFHRFLFEHVPGFAAIRVPARWASIAYAGLAMLIGNALTISRRQWIAAVVAVAFLIELRSAPIRWYMAITESRPVDRWMRDAMPHAVFELPLVENGDYAVMLRATAHHRPIVNGVSGFIPTVSEHLFELARDWSDRLAPELKRDAVSHIVIHADALDDRGRAWLSRALSRGEIGFIQRFDGGIFGDWLFGVGTPQRDSPLVAALLAGKPTFSDNTIALLERPLPEETLHAGSVVSGWALSPYGIREVNLLLNNGGIRIRAPLEDLPAIKREFPWYDATSQPRFIFVFANRPRGLRDLTDIQVEVIDGRGTRTLLEDRWIGWR
ncbi:MAG TPA: hypothetical protein VJ853_05670, partial [Thermoanaerobaculia bacterium]|nr:hypothetical protein [Thermoanaerobaculia bacterium]